MKTRACVILLTVLVAFNVSGQTLKKLRPGDRPVYMSASHLALLCEDWGSLHPGGKPPKDTDTLNVSVQEIVRSTACDAYIAGFEDAQLDFMGSRYHPVSAGLDYMQMLIDSFLRYVKDHPEEEDFAASTILDKVERVIVHAQTPESKR